MKKPVKDNYCRMEGYFFHLIIMIISIFFVRPSFAQEVMVAKLSESELAAVLPVLKAETSENDKFINAIVSQQDRHYSLFLDINSGKTDPLEWLKKYSKHIIVPQGSRYLPACSREVSVKSKELFKDSESLLKPSAVPTAVFTFGKDFPAINKGFFGETMTNEKYSKLLENPYNTTDPSVDELRVFIKDVNSFYTKNDFYVDYSPWGFLPVGTAFSFYHREDEEHIAGSINIFDFSLLDPSYPEVLKQCKQYVMGPVIEIHAESKLLDEIFSNQDNIIPVDENTRNSLKKAGITEERYALIKVSLMMARADSENPDAIEVPDFEFVPTTEEEKETARIIGQMKADALARKSNVIIYNRHKAELDPILDMMPHELY